jgi:hypothetical protein
MLTLMANTNYVESIRGFVHVLLHPVWICPNSCEYPAADHFLTSIITVCYYTQSKNPLKMMDVFHVKITIRVSHRQKPFVKMCFPGICWLNPHDWWRVPQKYIIYIFELEKMNRVQSKKKLGARHGDPTSQAFWCCKSTHFFGATSSKLTKLDQIKNPFCENPLIIPYDKQQSA